MRRALILLALLLFCGLSARAEGNVDAVIDALDLRALEEAAEGLSLIHI